MAQLMCCKDPNKRSAFFKGPLFRVAALSALGAGLVTAGWHASAGNLDVVIAGSLLSASIGILYLRTRELSSMPAVFLLQTKIGMELVLVWVLLLARFNIGLLGSRGRGAVSLLAGIMAMAASYVRYFYRLAGARPILATFSIIGICAVVAASITMLFRAGLGYGIWVGATMLTSWLLWFRNVLPATLMAVGIACAVPCWVIVGGLALAMWTPLDMLGLMAAWFSGEGFLLYSARRFARTGGDPFACAVMRFTVGSMFAFLEPVHGGFLINMTAGCILGLVYAADYLKSCLYGKRIILSWLFEDFLLARLRAGFKALSLARASRGLMDLVAVLFTASICAFYLLMAISFSVEAKTADRTVSSENAAISSLLPWIVNDGQ